MLKPKTKPARGMYSTLREQNQNSTDYIVAEELSNEAFQRVEDLHDIMITRNLQFQKTIRPLMELGSSCASARCMKFSKEDTLETKKL